MGPGHWVCFITIKVSPVSPLDTVVGIPVCRQLCTDLSRVRRSHPSRWRYMQLLLHGASPNCQPPNRNGVVHSRAISDIFERHLLGHLVRIVDLATRLHAMSPLLSLRPLLIVATCCFLSPWFPKECGPLPSAAHHLPLVCAPKTCVCLHLYILNSRKKTRAIDSIFFHFLLLLSSCVRCWTMPRRRGTRICLLRLRSLQLGYHQVHQLW